MNGRERILAALNRQEPDRVPTCEWVLNPKVMEQICNTASDLEFVQKMDLDGIAVGLDSKNTVIDDRHFIDEWGITRVSYDEYPNPVGFPIQELSDLDTYEVPDPDAPYRFNKIKKAMDLFGQEKCVIARVRDVFSQPRDLMGFENFLAGFYEEPELVQRLMEMSVEYSGRICENLAGLGIEVIVVGDDIANNQALLMNPDMYREQVLPHFEALVKKAKSLGLKVIKHSDGDLNSVVEDLVNTGIDCLDPIDARGNMDLAALKARYGNRIAFKGNVDCVETLVNKSEDQVRREVARCLLQGSVGGGHIISSSNSIHSGINPRNYKVFLDAVKELGRYPLDLEKLKQIAE